MASPSRKRHHSGRRSAMREASLGRDRDPGSRAHESSGPSRTLRAAAKRTAEPKRTASSLRIVRSIGLW